MYINGYEIIGSLQNDKSGYAKWGFAKKDGIQVFIKEFLSPVYPVETRELSPEQISRKREICNAFEKEKRKYYSEIGKCRTGNIITILDFFRSGSRFYIVTEKVDAASMNIEKVAKLSDEQKILICKIVLYNISTLHSHNIVHGDIKHDNILLKKTAKGSYTAKIIDFDSGFLESAAPKVGDDLQGDMVYLSPEAFLFIAEESGILTRKIDIFSLGILFHQYFSGEVPEFDKGKYDYLFEAILDDANVGISYRVPEFMRPILTDMLSKHPARRPNANDVLNALQQHQSFVPNITREEKPGFNRVETPGSGLISTMRTSKESEIQKEYKEKSFFRKADDLL